MVMPGRKYNSLNNYRYGFNGKELDKEQASFTTYDYGFRIYSPALAKFLSVDPLSKSYPWYTPYQFAGNKPVIAIDLDGLEEKITIGAMAWHSRPATQTETAITLADKAAAHSVAISGIMNKLQIDEINKPTQPPSVLEWGTMGHLT